MVNSDQPKLHLVRAATHQVTGFLSKLNMVCRGILHDAMVATTTRRRMCMEHKGRQPVYILAKELRAVMMHRLGTAIQLVAMLSSLSREIVLVVLISRIIMVVPCARLNKILVPTARIPIKYSIKYS